jgi:coenzyme PQQ precursor peptide PqqA
MFYAAAIDAAQSYAYIDVMHNLQEKSNMKTWTKPVVTTVDAGLEVTRYLPSALDVAAGRSCK